MPVGELRCPHGLLVDCGCVLCRLDASTDYSIKLQRLIENLKYDTEPPYPELYHHKMIVAAKARIAALEAALRMAHYIECGPCGCEYCNYWQPTAETPAKPTPFIKRCEPHGIWKCELCWPTPKTGAKP